MSKSTDRKQLSPGEISSFCAELALIIKAGIPVQEGVSIMAEDAHSDCDRELLTELQKHLDMGSTLAFSIGATAIFPKYAVDMIEIGEVSGRLDEVMDSLCDYYERNEAITRSIKNAVTYPAVMIVMMVAVIMVLVIKVLPIFGQVFRQLGSEMSSFATGIMDFGAAVSRYSVVLVGLIAVLAAAFVLLRATKGGRGALSRLYDSCFLTRKLSGLVSTGRFASAMALMLESGLDTDHSLDMAYELISSEKTRAKVAHLRELIAGGQSFSDALLETKVFSGVYARMISIGFKTGSADAVMKKIALRYEEEIDTRISNLLSILEPTLVAVLSVIVGMILLSVMLPLMGIMTSIG